MPLSDALLRESSVYKGAAKNETFKVFEGNQADRATEISKNKPTGGKGENRTLPKRKGGRMLFYNGEIREESEAPSATTTKRTLMSELGLGRRRKKASSP